jgi:hypothetical protein
VAPAALVCLLVLIGVALVPGPAEASASTATPAPPLGPLILSQPLPGYVAAPPGPTNGPLTASAFASESSTPQRAQEQFDNLAAEPDFGAFIRLWTDGSGPGKDQNDVAVLVFRIPDQARARSFAAGLLVPYRGGAGSTPFDVPSVPGAHGFTVALPPPKPAVEQVVVFRAGRYVVMVQAASATSASNTAVLTPTQAITASYQQFGALRFGDPSGSSDGAPPVARHAPAVKPAVAPASAPASIPALVWAAVGAAAAIAVTLALAAYRRRRRSRRTSTPDTNPWGPGGLLESFGATVPYEPAPDTGGRAGGGTGTIRLPARTIPSLASTPWPLPTDGSPGARPRSPVPIPSGIPSDIESPGGSP